MLPTNTPRAVMTAATCTSLWVSTPSITSLAALSSWSSDTGWGILGMVVCLLITNGMDGHRPTGAGGQNCDGALLMARPLSGHTHPVRRQQAPPQAAADRSAPRHVSQLRCGSDHGPGWHAGDPHSQTET